ncbi:MarR family winged helix-turn-helix transcriptional regulator [Actinomyces minihominis]|uniref:MarR family winged helix-turn-helix transcriptional regulator n=1 Tax=Actinomyces minihominis TaxID=2002838 RepID=UPI000C0716F9|nr:MarR family transcriptional regulator [Actinomyces minihominis]
MAQDAANGIEERDNKRSLAWRVFFEASTRLQGSLETQLKTGANMSLSDYNILLMLYESEGRQMRMGELAERLGFIPSRLTYLVGGLIKAGWVNKKPSGTDRRGYVAALTDAGVEATEHASRIHQATVRQLLLDDLTDAHIDQIVDAFGHLDRKAHP